MSQLDQQAFKNIMGIEETILKGKINSALENFISPKVPETLQLNPHLDVIEKGNNIYLLKTQYGRIEVAKEIYNMLQNFKGGIKANVVNEKYPLIGLDFNGKSMLKSFIQERILIEHAD